MACKSSATSTMQYRILTLDCCVQGHVEENASAMLIEALNLRWDYCRAAQQSFPSTTLRFLQRDQPNGSAGVDDTVHDEKQTVEGKSRLVSGLPSRPQTPLTPRPPPTHISPGISISILIGKTDSRWNLEALHGLIKLVYRRPLTLIAAMVR